MNPFGDDLGGIEDLFNRLAGSQKNIQNNSRITDEDAVLETISTKKGVFLIFDFSNNEVTNVVIGEDYEESAYDGASLDNQKVLKISFKKNQNINYFLPKNVNKKNFEWTSKNGILEVFLKK